MRSGGGGGGFKRLREMRPVLCALVRQGLENMGEGSENKGGKHKNMERVSSEEKRVKSPGAGTRHRGSGRVYLEGFLQNYIVSSVPESISVTRQRQLRSLNMLPDYQLSGPDWASGEHLFSETSRRIPSHPAGV